MNALKHDQEYDFNDVNFDIDSENSFMIQYV